MLLVFYVEVRVINQKCFAQFGCFKFSKQKKILNPKISRIIKHKKRIFKNIFFSSTSKISLSCFFSNKKNFSIHQFSFRSTKDTARRKKFLFFFPFSSCRNRKREHVGFHLRTQDKRINTRIFLIRALVFLAVALVYAQMECRAQKEASRMIFSSNLRGLRGKKLQLRKF